MPQPIEITATDGEGTYVKFRYDGAADTLSLPTDSPIGGAMARAVLDGTAVQWSRVIQPPAQQQPPKAEWLRVGDGWCALVADSAIVGTSAVLIGPSKVARLTKVHTALKRHSDGRMMCLLESQSPGDRIEARNAAGCGLWDW